MDTYADRWIQCTPTEVRIRGYYVPWGTKRIPYASIRGVRRVALSTMRGQLRIWGTSNPRYWASLDPGRPRKQVGFVFDLGRAVRPLVTPEDPDGFDAALRAHSPVAPTDEERPGPVV